MKIKAIAQAFSICKLKAMTDIHFQDEFFFLSKTDDEISLVCPMEHVPKNVIEREDGWRAFRVQGVLDFSLVGILAKISGLLAEKSIGIFAISTYNTDYILTKSVDHEKALRVLEEAGYQME